MNTEATFEKLNKTNKLLASPNLGKSPDSRSSETIQIHFSWRCNRSDITGKYCTTCEGTKP